MAWVSSGPRGCGAERLTRALENVASLRCTSDERFREMLLTEGILTASNGGVEFSRDYLFSSPSMAAVALQARSANGWFEWKDASGKTLDEVKRRAVPPAG